MTNVLRIAHLRIAHHVCNPEVGKREIHQNVKWVKIAKKCCCSRKLD